MTVKCQVSRTFGGLGLSIQRATVRETEGGTPRQVTLPVGKAGTLSTRTDADTGEVTLSGGHGITTGMLVDVHWVGGVRYGITAGTVAGNVVPIDAGAGDDLPAQATAVVMTPVVQINGDIGGDELSILVFEVAYPPNSTATAHLDFQDADDDSIAEIDAVANEPQSWDVDAGSDNPFTGDPITKIMASNGSATQEGVLTLIALFDPTP